MEKLNYPSKNINFKIANIFLVFIHIFGVFTLGHKSLFAKSDNIDNSISIDYLNKKETVDYILGEGDQIMIQISEEIPELSKMVLIDIDGTINLPRLKRVYVSGLSIPELTRLLNER